VYRLSATYRTLLSWNRTWWSNSIRVNREAFSHTEKPPLGAAFLLS
jgi:hypothetical protein